MKIKVNKSQRELFRPYVNNIDKLIEDGDLSELSDALIRAIFDYGFDGDEANSLGQKLDKAYDEIYDQNVRKPNIFMRWYLRRKDGEF